ncbi:Prostaglandin F synthase 1 [Camelus dromedarius]|uniref:Prostaglandin F synthase 1 n=1 Tax=Camelus dromedarius TaxID=9838 RepID=A0A5N4C5E6_CAMDR|nr:Prostaglandin F synthase 1 [Camelus dromedarius]KAB1254132.1 Prostaglandin F synthase 1 [Camelus dromedarius]
MDPKHQRRELTDGRFIPVLGFGTFAPEEVTILAKGEVEMAVKRAIDAGYRHIDSAYLYQNEEEIGRAIQEKMADGTVKRDDIFYTTKVLCLAKDCTGSLSPALVTCILFLLYLSCLKNDLIFHSPPIGQFLSYLLTSAPLKTFSLLLCLSLSHSGPTQHPTFDYASRGSYTDHSSLPFPPEAMEKCKDAGLAKSIGVSNFNHEQLEKILNKPGLKHKPVCNQVECHPYLNQSKLLEFCTSKDILLVAYAPLGSDSRKAWVKKNHPALLQDPVLGAIAEKHGRTPAQVALRYQASAGVGGGGGVFDFQLTPEDMERLDGLNRDMHYMDDEP